MKHIFMGQINTVENYCLCTYTNDIYRKPYPCLLSKEINSFFIYSQLKPFIKNISGIIKINKETKYGKILETDLIKEKCLENSCVKLDNEEYCINKVVQCTNGDVICYTNKVIEEIQDEKSLEVCNKIIEDFEKYRIQRMKQKREEKKSYKNKKWYEFWKKEGD